MQGAENFFAIYARGKLGRIYLKEQGVTKQVKEEETRDINFRHDCNEKTVHEMTFLVPQCAIAAHYKFKTLSLLSAQEASPKKERQKARTSHLGVSGEANMHICRRILYSPKLLFYSFYVVYTRGHIAPRTTRRHFRSARWNWRTASARTKEKEEDPCTENVRQKLPVPPGGIALRTAHIYYAPPQRDT